MSTLSLVLPLLLTQSSPPAVSNEFTPPPIARFMQSTTKCVDGTEIEAAFRWQKGTVTAVTLRALGHNLSEAEKKEIDEFLRRIGHFSYIEAFCSGPGLVTVVIHGSNIRNGDLKDVTIAWKARGFHVF